MPLAYVGPQPLMPVMSVVVGIVAVLLIFGKPASETLRRVLAALRRTPATGPESGRTPETTAQPAAENELAQD